MHQNYPLRVGINSQIQILCCVLDLLNKTQPLTHSLLEHNIRPEPCIPAEPLRLWSANCVH